MGLKKTWTHTKTNATYTDAYHRVWNVTLQTEECMEFMVMIYTTHGDRMANYSTLASIAHKMRAGGSRFDNFFTIALLDQANMNPVKAAYNYLKTLPEYIGSTDI